MTTATVNFLANLSNEQLTDRLAKIEANGKRAKAMIGTSADRAGSPVMVHGKWQSSTSATETLNICRQAWLRTRTEMRRRGMLATAAA